MWLVAILALSSKNALFLRRNSTHDFWFKCPAFNIRLSHHISVAIVIKNKLQLKTLQVCSTFIFNNYFLVSCNMKSWSFFFWNLVICLRYKTRENMFYCQYRALLYIHREYVRKYQVQLCNNITSASYSTMSKQTILKSLRVSLYDIFIWTPTGTLTGTVVLRRPSYSWCFLNSIEHKNVKKCRYYIASTSKFIDIQCNYTWRLSPSLVISFDKR